LDLRRTPGLLILLAVASPGCRTRLPGFADMAPRGDGGLDDLATADLACARATVSGWQFHDGPGPMCVDQMFPMHGDPAEYQFATIPAEGDDWRDWPPPIIDASRGSRLCGTRCTCNGVDFEYWQLFVDVPDGVTVTRLGYLLRSVDDGARLTIFNTLHPEGQVAEESYAFLGTGVAANLASHLAPGRNRIVLTHLDDCCQQNIVSGAHVSVDDQLPSCP
jgi:hypothetical protein